MTLLLRGCFVTLICGCFAQDNLDYEVSLANGLGSRLATTLWLQPAFCFYENWLRQSSNKYLIKRETASIHVEVMEEGNNATYTAVDTHSIPLCGILFPEPQDISEYGYQLGPDMLCKNNTCTAQLLPRKNYRVRYILYNEEGTAVAASSWSQPLQTRDVQDFRTINVGLEARSGGMVVITVLLSIAMFFLLIGLAIALIIKRP
ncbi:uroplakin-3a-like [Protopterus annectens]|uniref:uroplakin-3a-like n=1 Tax=Protopterus annectens TaxID=7888 RepID=UPI001CFC3220|nr:uroplakin-3a-like [Protopterus annectens]